MFDTKADLLNYSMHFTSLFLCMVIMLTRQIKGCSIESEDIVKKIAAELRKMETNDCMLYTPSLADYEQNCSRSTLTCFALEVNVLVLEIKSVTWNSKQLFNMLNRLSKKIAPLVQVGK
ncbi:interleukin 15, like [Myxocyprinus asiaticus]|uniref:interleukin 15, like n=1 Tax=Myxocyprinus asiaticus TaxID=70543 RepID=UPI0022232674|nr:interleukin 15, like [Myxocyprinus asiaticus]